MKEHRTLPNLNVEHACVTMGMKAVTTGAACVFFVFAAAALNVDATRALASAAIGIGWAVLAVAYRERRPCPRCRRAGGDPPELLD